MDKIAVNNFIVTLKKDVKAAKAMVAGNLTRKIGLLKKELETKKDDDVQTSKIESKIEKVHSDIKLLKTIDTYDISKDALMKPDPKHWNGIISNSKVSPKECLKARVICKTRVQKQVQQFRSQNIDCDEWLEEYFEFREKKRELITATLSDKKKKSRHSNVKKEKSLDRSYHTKRSEQCKDNQKTIHMKSEGLHPSWESKRREKAMLKEAFSKIVTDDGSASNHRKLLNTDVQTI